MRGLYIFLALLSLGYCRIEFSEHARNFSIELFYYTAEETKWHTVISPFGVWSLLTDISIGATGNSRIQLLSALRLPENKSFIWYAYNYLNEFVLKGAGSDVLLKSKNYLFFDTTFRLSQNYRSVNIGYGIKPATLSFRSSQNAAYIANTIIKDSGATVSNVLRSDDFEDSRTILTNVMSFKGLWQFAFNPLFTELKPFYDEDQNEIGQVNMMYQRAMVSYSNIRWLQAIALELPYGNDGSEYSFLALLPYKRSNVKDVYRRLTDISLPDIMEKLEADIKKFGLQSIEIGIPRFKISSNVVLNGPLNNMGIVDIFNEDYASFDDVTLPKNVFISRIVHKADIEVIESGKVASAATTDYFANRYFEANRPFIYFIIEKSTTTILFEGVYSKPSVF